MFYGRTFYVGDDEASKVEAVNAFKTESERNMYCDTTFTERLTTSQARSIQRAGVTVLEWRGVDGFVGVDVIDI